MAGVIRYNSPGRIEAASSRGLANLIDTDGLATLDSNGNIVEPARAVTTTATVAAGDVRYATNDLWVHDGTAERKVYNTTDAGVASGIATLDSNTNVVEAARKATTTATTGAGDIRYTDNDLHVHDGTAERKIYNTTDSSATPTANLIPLADANGDLDNGWIRDDLMKYTAAPLTAQNIKDMYGAPVTLIAAPGANKAIIVHDLVFEMKRSATAFTGGGAVSIEYASGSDVVATIAAAVVTGAAGTTLSSRVMVDLSDVALANIENDAIKITNATAAFADGTGTAEVHIWYSVIDVTA